MRITATVNGKARVAEGVGSHDSLLWVLRSKWGLAGSKDACRQGECGSCTVRLDGRAVCSCLVPAGQADGAEIVTAEASGSDPGLSTIGSAMLTCGAVQCGFCTPGLVVAIACLIEEIPHPTDGQIRESLAGNLCRCTGYEKIVEAVHLAASTWPGR